MWNIQIASPSWTYHKVLSTLWKLSAFPQQHYLYFLTLTIHICNQQFGALCPNFFKLAYRFAGTFTDPSAICPSASMLVTFVQYSISVPLSGFLHTPCVFLCPSCAILTPTPGVFLLSKKISLSSPQVESMQGVFWGLGCPPTAASL